MNGSTVGVSDALAQRRSQLSAEQQARLYERLRGTQHPLDAGIAPRPTAESAPLSYAQQRIWMLDQLDPGSTAYNISNAFRLSGVLDLGALQQSIDTIVARHELLRTHFAQHAGTPFQRVGSADRLPLHTVDLSDIAPAQQEQEVQHQLHAAADQPFELHHGPLWRVQLWRLEPSVHVVLLTLHHIISDGWSWGVLMHELMTCYAAAAAGRAHGLPDLPIQYADYAYWQRDRLQSAAMQPQIDYWMRQLADLPAPLELPTDRPRTRVQAARHIWHPFRIAPDLAARLERFSSQAGATLFMTLLAAFKVLLHRYTNQRDLVVGSPIANRNRAELEPLIGVFINMLALRTQLSGQLSFRQVLERVRTTALDGYRNQDVPIEKLFELLEIDHSADPLPLFRVMFVLQNSPRPAVRLPHLAVASLAVDKWNTPYDLTLDITCVDGGLSGGLEYNPDLFDAPTITRMLGHFTHLLDTLIAQPDARIGTFSLMGERERQQVLGVAARPGLAYPADVSFHDLFAQCARQHPDALAVVADDQRLTYAELDRRANQVAHALREQGIRRGVCVGLAMERAVEVLVGLLAILKAGAIYLPLDPAAPAARLGSILADARAPLVLTQAHLRQRLPPEISGLCLDADWPQIATQPATPPACHVSSLDGAYIIYTSGSSGVPKGVLVAHQALVSHCVGFQQTYGLGTDDRVLQFSSLTFDTSLEEMLPALISGATVVLRSNELWSARTFCDKVAALGITIVDLPTAYWHMLATELAESRAPLPAHRLRMIMVGGEALSSSHLARWQRTSLRDLRLVNSYGPTEATITTCVFEVPHTWHPADRVPLGRPLPNRTLFVLDSAGQPVPVGVPGEMYLSGSGLAQGYLHRPGLTARQFVPNPFSAEPGARLYRTGDLGRYRPDGTIEFLGRCDQQVKIRGYRVELGEIEAALAAHPALRAATVAARADTPGDTRLVAYVVQNPLYAGAVDDAHGEQIAAWQSVYESLYSQHAPAPDPTFDTSGWNSSYTGEPLSAAVMREWVEHSVARILALRPRRVLELGCGFGMLLFRIAPQCSFYRGTDFSRRAITHVQQQLATLDLPQVALAQRVADDFSDEAELFDTVIINSVSQHFPSVDYLAVVLAQAANRTASGGRLFVGDVRNHALLEAFHTAVELHRSDAALPLDQLRERIQARTAQERELLVSPAFFTSLRAIIPRIAGVCIQLKRGSHHSELTRFRFDATLYLDTAPPVLVATEVIDWAQAMPTVAAMHAMLAERKPAVLRVCGVPNARLAETLAAAKLLAEDAGWGNLGDVRAQLPAAQPGLDPEQIWLLAEQLPYDVDICWSSDGADGRYDVIFAHRRPAGDLERVLAPTPPAGQRDDWRSYANNPLRASFARALAPQLRSYLQAKLPDYMVPSAFVLLDALPLTPNGKIDRRALPPPAPVAALPPSLMVVPRTPLEAQVAEIWAAILGLPQISVDAPFFSVGGHSLLATQIIARIHDTFQIDLPLRTLLTEQATVASMAEAIAAWDGPATAGDHGDALPALVDDLAARQQPFPLTDLQQAYWVGGSDLFELGTVSPHGYQEIELEGFDLARLEQVLQRLVARHEMLRAVMLPNGQQQILATVPPYTLTAYDLRGQQLAQIEPQIAAVRSAMVDTGPAIDRWPLFDVRAHILDAGRVRLHTSISLLICDGWSFEIFMRELLQLYGDLDSALPPIEMSYRDYVLAAARRETTAQFARAQAYWASRLATLPPAPDLPLAKSPALVQQPHFVRRTTRMDPARWQAIKDRAAAAGLTPNMVLCTAYALVLETWSKTQSFTINLLFANRLPLHEHVGQVIGNFSTTLLLEVDLQQHAPFATAARALQMQLANDMDHSAISGVQVARELSRRHGWSSRATTPVVFASTLNLPSADRRVIPAALRSTDIYGSIQTPQVWLDHQVFEVDGELILNWDVVEELFPTGMIDAMFMAYCGLLDQLAAGDAAWSAAALLVPREQLAQRAQINATAAPIPSGLLHAGFAAHAARDPAQLAVIAAGGTLTYGELDCQSLAVAHWLRQRGARPNTLVAVVMEKGWEQVVAALGVLRAGAAYLPIDPALPPERLLHLLEHGQVTCVLTTPASDRSQPWPAQIERLVVDQRLVAAARMPDLDPAQTPDDLAYVIYTSGSTGQPKGVMIDHRAALNTVVDLNQRFQVGPNDRILALSSLSFDLSVYDLFGMLAAGGTIVIPSAEQQRDPAHWAALLVEQQVTIWNSVPALLDLWSQHVSGQAMLFPAALRLIMLSGDWIPLDLPGRAQQLVPAAQIYSLGGATEAAIWSILYPIGEVDPSWRSVPYGFPMCNQQFHVLNQRLEPCPTHVSGQLYIGGIGLARGYWRDPARTAASFIQHPQTGERLYRTGDLGRYRPDGVIEILGREDFQVKIQGYRIELGEIESAFRAHPGVGEVVTAVREDSPGEKRLVAYVVPRGALPAGHDLRTFVAAKLPSYMVPAAVVLLDALPLSSNGKIDRRALPAPEATRPPLAAGYQAPRNEHEAHLVAIWEEVLGIAPIGVADQFFDLGGTSLAALRLIAQIQERFGHAPGLGALFSGATVASQAQELAQQLALP